MSIRHYSPRRNRRNGISFRSKTLLGIVLGITIGLQILYPLIDGEFLRVVTIATVYWAAGAMALHALLAYGARYAFTYLGTTVVFALLVESVGVKTGWPFGTYEYDPSLGHTIAGVPYVVPFAWVMMAHPALIAARRVAGNWYFSTVDMQWRLGIYFSTHKWLRQIVGVGPSMVHMFHINQRFHFQILLVGY